METRVFVLCALHIVRTVLFQDKLINGDQTKGQIQTGGERESLAQQHINDASCMWFEEFGWWHECNSSKL